MNELRSPMRLSISRQGLAAVVWFIGLAAVGVQALALATKYFQPWLSADYIYPQLFAEDVLAGRYPLAGWTLSSAPYFFPDMAVAIGLRAVGGAGTVLPAYVVFSYLSLAVLAGWSLQRATHTGWAAWLGGVAFVNALLLWRTVGDHAHYLWLLGTVGFHGGAVLMGLANFSLWAGPEENGLSRRRWAVALTVLFAGAISDTLFLTQAALPLGVGLWAQAGWNFRRPRVRAYLQAVLVAVGLVALVRGGLYFFGWFKFSNVVRYAPTPAGIGQAAVSFSRDVSGILVPGAWGLVAMGVASLGIVGVLWWRERRQRHLLAPEVKPATGFALVGLAATTLVPLVTVFWRDAHHVRYLLPWLVWPGWLALVWILPKIRHWGNDARGLVACGAISCGLTALALPQIRLAALRWPYSEQQAQLDEYLVRRGLRHGLSDYWHAHAINVLTRAPVRLFALRPGARASFWNNNAFWFYENDGGRGRLRVPDYSFIITDGLDEAALRRRFGEPAERELVGGLTIWRYPAAASRGLAQEMQGEVRDFLSGRPGEEEIADGR